MKHKRVRSEHNGYLIMLATLQRIEAVAVMGAPTEATLKTISDLARWAIRDAKVKV